MHIGLTGEQQALRDELRAYLLAHGVKTEVHYPIPPHRQAAMRGILEGDYPIAGEVHATELSLPISYATTPGEAAEVCRLARQFFATRAVGCET